MGLRQQGMCREKRQGGSSSVPNRLPTPEKRPIPAGMIPISSQSGSAVQKLPTKLGGTAENDSPHLWGGFFYTNLQEDMHMKLSHLFLNTQREMPSEAEIPSHSLMLRASLLQQVASGVYAYLPLGYRVIRKMEQIIREEMDAAGAQEVLMSALIPSELFKASGRWDIFGEEMFRLKDRNGRDFCLGPTHEELFTETVKQGLRSYKSLPVTLYQIQTKYRDERRPRFGVIRSREFIMKDAYSFDSDESGLDDSYRKMHDAYCRIFDRLGLKYRIVDADSGAMGGSGSQEFVVLNPAGEDQVVYCPSCSYAANLEKAVGSEPCGNSAEPSEELKRIETPGVHTIEEVCAFFHCQPDEVGKTMIYLADRRPIAVVVRGDRDVSENKLKNLLGCKELLLAPGEVVEQVTGAQVGFAGPVGIQIPLYADHELQRMPSFVSGGNQTDCHITGTNAKRDMSKAHFADLRNAAQGDNCPHCGHALRFAKGIEIGHIFKLGTKYSKALGCTYIDKGGREAVPMMGCYGIGVSRLVAAVVEQYHDENGICWPFSVAPYQVIVTPVKYQDPINRELAEHIYNQLLSEGIQVLLDDRAESAGVKFKDADLLGIPMRIVVGRKANERIVECKLRAEKDSVEMSADDAMEQVRKRMNSMH